MIMSRSQWQCGLKLWSTAARLLRSWVRIPPVSCISVCSVCFCCHVEVSMTSCSLVQKSPTDCGASLCVITKPPERGGHSCKARRKIILMIAIISKNWSITYLLTYLLIPCSTVLLEKLTGLHLVKKFPAFYGTRKFITAFTSARHLPLSWAISIQSIPHIPLPEDPP
jgi:hypothetical protein